MGNIRWLDKRDIPGVIALRRKTFTGTLHSSTDDLAAYYEDVLFRHPWLSDDIRSLVYTSDDGEIQGFLAIIPRPMTLKGQPIRAAVSTEFMSAPEAGGAVAIRLLRAYLKGPQDFSVTDVANDTARALLESVGAKTIPWYSLYWSCVLRPLQYGASLLGWHGISGIGKPFFRAFDHLTATNLPGHFRRRPPSGDTITLNPEIIVAHSEKMAKGHAIRPVYDSRSIAWLIEHLGLIPNAGILHARAVRDSQRNLRGWFIYFRGPQDRATVVQLAALPAHKRFVFDHLMHHAWCQGVIVVGGRLDREYWSELADSRASYRLGRPWTLVHSRRLDILDSFYAGQVAFSRLDGQWWLAF